MKYLDIWDMRCELQSALWLPGFQQGGVTDVAQMHPLHTVSKESKGEGVSGCGYTHDV